MSQIEEMVIATGAYGGQTINYFGKKLLPGVLVKMPARDAEGFGKNVRIVERLVNNLEVPKPTKPAKGSVETPLRAIQAAELGRMERGGINRKED